MASSSRSLHGEKEPPMRLPSRVRVIATSFVLAAVSLATFVASALADTFPGPIPK